MKRQDFNGSLLASSGGSFLVSAEDYPAAGRAGRRRDDQIPGISFTTSHCRRRWSDFHRAQSSLVGNEAAQSGAGS